MAYQYKVKVKVRFERRAEKFNDLQRPSIRPSAISNTVIKEPKEKSPSPTMTRSWQCKSQGWLCILRANQKKAIGFVCAGRICEWPYVFGGRSFSRSRAAWQDENGILTLFLLWFWLWAEEDEAWSLKYWDQEDHDGMDVRSFPILHALSTERQVISRRCVRIWTFIHFCGILSLSGISFPSHMT